MNSLKAAVLILAALSLLLGGCSSPIRTLEYKDGRLSMVEERSGGGTCMWELKQVSSTAEKNALRKEGWKFECVVHNEGGADTFLMKRKANIKTLVPAPAALPPFHPMLITVFGTHPTPDGSWKIGVSEDSIDFAHPASGGVGFTPDSHGWKAQTGWFVFIESTSKLWAYDGNRLLWLYVETHAETSSGCAIYPGVFRATNFDSNFPCAVPAEVISQLPEQKQKDIQKHE